MLPLAFAAIAFGVALVAAGLRNQSIGEVLEGKLPKPEPTEGASGGVVGQAFEVHLPPEASAKLKEIAQSKGWSVHDWLNVIQRESGGNPQATNSETGAYGIGQINPENKANPLEPRPGSTASHYPKYKGNPVEQIEAMAEYIEHTYGNPTNAWQHEQTLGWY